MITRYIHHVKVELPAATEGAAEARGRLADKFPRAALRRMTHLGMLVGATLDGVVLSPEAAVVYATTYAETRALEDFLTSFPTASPLLFQTSIHPGGIQQVLVGRQQSIARLWPIASNRNLLRQALTTAWLETAPQIVIVGGEERGTWMLEGAMAAAHSFAFSVVMKSAAEGAIAQITFAPEPREAATEVTTEQFALALAERKPISVEGPSGSWQLEWL
ncbi:hypothetical protein [Oleiharenicola lentus]|uniref:hypothetical protein n=1 Tax=Oleiharenicola lentus TaxID=2508720 RepID=UPI003F66C32D